MRNEINAVDLALAERMQRTRHDVSASLVRLFFRDLIEVPAIL